MELTLLTLRRQFLPTAIRMSRRNKLVYPCRVEGWLNVCGKFFTCFVTVFSAIWRKQFFYMPGHRLLVFICFLAGVEIS